MTNVHVSSVGCARTLQRLWRQTPRFASVVIRMAKELGLMLHTLMKNVPSAAQSWKAPVKVWIRGIYEKRQERLQRKSHALEQSTTPSKQPEGVDHDCIVRDW